jgi:hypothetical protein
MKTPQQLQHQTSINTNTRNRSVALIRGIPVPLAGAGVFHARFFYNHAHRPRLDKLLYLELSRSSNGNFKLLLDPGGSFASKTAARRFQK